VPLDGDGSDEGWLDGALPRLVPKARPTWR
jgi:hypothetical protein